MSQSESVLEGQHPEREHGERFYPELWEVRNRLTHRAGTPY